MPVDIDPSRSSQKHDKSQKCWNKNFKFQKTVKIIFLKPENIRQEHSRNDIHELKGEAFVE